MPTKPKDGAPATTPNPNHDQQAAGLYQTIALRFYARYVDARHRAKFRGEDLPGAEALLTSAEASERYRLAADEWVSETPATADAARALISFAGVIAADKLIDNVLCETGPASDEKDALHQTIALASAAEWVNEIAVREWLDRRTAAYGPSGMPPNGGQP